tara:strand:+ start:37 stop:276 length:240 start_codon:yes stop_codon:yes gene_type:complete
VYRQGKADTYKSDRFLTFTEAAEILGYANHTRISEMVCSGILPSYTIPLSKKLRVKKSEFYSLVLDKKGKGKPLACSLI